MLDTASTPHPGKARVLPGTTRSMDTGTRPEAQTASTIAGFREIAIDSEPQGSGVGTAQLAEPVADRPLPRRLFTFLR